MHHYLFILLMAFSIPSMSARKLRDQYGTLEKELRDMDRDEEQERAALLEDAMQMLGGAEAVQKHSDEVEVDVEETLAMCVNKVCRKKKIGLGNIWMVEDDRLVLSPTFQAVASDSQKLLEFGVHCRKITFSMGQGLPGRTWATMKEQWVENVQDFTVDKYPRLEIAKACGIQTCSLSLSFSLSLSLSLCIHI
jgi:putative methionine-R-sulfoxide reductase with GAF domain